MAVGTELATQIFTNNTSKEPSTCVDDSVFLKAEQETANFPVVESPKDALQQTFQIPQPASDHGAQPGASGDNGRRVYDPTLLPVTDDNTEKRPVDVVSDRDGRNAMYLGIPKEIPQDSDDDDDKGKRKEQKQQEEQEEDEVVEEGEKTRERRREKKRKKFRKTKCILGLCFMVLAVIGLGSMAVAITSMGMRESTTISKLNRTMELLQSDTILLWQGTSSIVVKFSNETKLDQTDFYINIYSVPCDDLELQNNALYDSGSKHFSLEYPLMLPRGYLHYELYSALNYSLLLSSPQNTSTNLTVFVFNSTTDADEYISHHTDESAKRKAIMKKEIQERGMGFF